MIKILRDIIRGAGYLPGYGHHPGNTFVVIMLIAMPLAGASNENLEWIMGLLLGLAGWGITILPLYIVGCLGRARDYARHH